MTFKEFLDEREPKVREAERRRQAVVRDWVNACHELFKQIQEWLEESDSKKLLLFKSKSLTRNENRLGEYITGALEIWLGGQGAELNPVARYVRGPVHIVDPAGEWTGRVDLAGQGEVFEIYRFTHKDHRQTWWLRDTEQYQLQQLTKDAIEKCLMVIFR